MSERSSRQLSHSACTSIFRESSVDAAGNLLIEIPRYLGASTTKQEDSNAHSTDANITVNEVTLKGRGKLSLACNWGVGIGGGLWSTGLLLTEHLCNHAALYDDALRDRRVLELGSGTGLVGERNKKQVYIARGNYYIHPLYIASTGGTDVNMTMLCKPSTGSLRRAV